MIHLRATVVARGIEEIAREYPGVGLRGRRRSLRSSGKDEERRQQERLAHHTKIHALSLPEHGLAKDCDRPEGFEKATDAHLAAVMLVNAGLRILTFNGRHFERFPGIAVLDPARVQGCSGFRTRLQFVQLL